MEAVREERWDDWVARQLRDPDSGINQLIQAGFSRDTALLCLMLGRIHAQLLDLERVLEPPPDDWNR